MSRTQQIEQLEQDWQTARWQGITRPYSAAEVVNLRGSLQPACTLAERGAEKLWALLNGKAKKGYITSLTAAQRAQTVDIPFLRLAIQQRP